MIILLAGLGVGLYFGLSGGSSTDAASTVTTVAASSTTAPTTTEPPTTTSTVLETTTSEPTTTTEQTTTTLAVDPALAARMAEWEALLETIPGSGPEKVAEVAAWLTPKDQAQSRAAEIVEWWSTAGDPEEIIQDEPFVGVIRTIVSPDGANATILSSYDLICRDGLTTRSLGSTTWKLDDGQWMRTVDYAAPAPVDGSVAFFGGSVRAGDLLWSPDYLNELKHLAAKGGPDTPGMFLAVEFFVRNSGPTALAPSGFQVTAIDANGKEYGLSQAADNWWNLDVEDRETKIAPGEYTWLWYTFEIPEGADLQSFQYRVTLPEV